MQNQNEFQGVLCVNKPEEFTSFDVIAKLRGILQMRRLGHTGTLDPMATGVLPVLVGRATKACDILPDTSKEYCATAKFGVETDTQDIWGNVLRTEHSHITREEILEVLPRFSGEIFQVPPMYSAVSVQGKRLYEWARNGVTVERPSRRVNIDRIAIENFDAEHQTATFRIHCGKGTYIRTLIADIGAALGTCAVMTSLVRTKACGFSLDMCSTFSEISRFMQDGTLSEHLIPTDTLFATYPAITLSSKQAIDYQNGVRLRLDEVGVTAGTYRVYRNGIFLGTATANETEGVLRIGKNFFTEGGNGNGKN